MCRCRFVRRSALIATSIRRWGLGRGLCPSFADVSPWVRRRDRVSGGREVLWRAERQAREGWGGAVGLVGVIGMEGVSGCLGEVDGGRGVGGEILGGGKRYSAGPVPGDDEMAEFYETACAVLEAAGYRHYEISNWAKPGFASRHNLKYWRREPYLGFGAGAHSFSGTERWANAHDAADYVNAGMGGRLPVEQHEKLTAEGAVEEELFL